MADDFVPTFTRAGLVAVRAQDARGLRASVSALAVGRGAASGGGYVGYTPTGYETGLRGEVSRQLILSGSPLGDPAGVDPIGFRVLSVFPPLAAGIAATPIHEVGVFLDDGTLLCVWSATNGADLLGSITSASTFELAFDLYFGVIPASALTITVQTIGDPDNLAALFELMRGVARNYTQQMRASHRLARRGIQE